MNETWIVFYFYLSRWMWAVIIIYQRFVFIHSIVSKKIKIKNKKKSRISRREQWNKLHLFASLFYLVVLNEKKKKNGKVFSKQQKLNKFKVQCRLEPMLSIATSAIELYFVHFALWLMETNKFSWIFIYLGHNKIKTTISL